MDLVKLKNNEIVKDNQYLVANGITNWLIVDKIIIGDNKTIDFENTETGATAQVFVEGRGVIRYDGREINLPNMMGICEQVLGVKL